MSTSKYGKRPTARCLNPVCKFTISWRHGQKPPSACPLCGYTKSQEDLTRIRAQIALNKERETAKKIEEHRLAIIAALPWWKRWAIGLGLMKGPVVKALGLLLIALLAGCDVPKEKREWPIFHEGRSCRQIAYSDCGMTLECKGGGRIKCAVNVWIEP